MWLTNNNVWTKFIGPLLTTLAFSPRLPLSPLPKSSESAVAQTEPGSADPEPAQIVPAQPPSWEPGLFAVVMIGSRQYIVHPGRWIVVQRLKGANVNDKISLHKVLLVGTDTSCYIGKPIVTNAVVYATVEEQGLDPKVIVFKYKKKKHYRRTIGHRQVLLVQSNYLSNILQLKCQFAWLGNSWELFL
ncbi:50S ribosomal protein L21 [Spatholobus suberectus]|nr:50S ribosomal protein L21 [Spatholobus suberectus]